MSRSRALPRTRARTGGRQARRLALLLLTTSLGVLGALPGGPAGASQRRARAVALPLAASAGWCAMHGSTLGGWTETSPNLPICGPGPDYGGSWGYVDLPGPGGAMGAYYNATPGFQCVELAERWLAVADGLAPQHAEGASLAAVYHAAFARSTLVVNGSAGAVGHPPVRGDVVSFSLVPSFEDPSDGHVAVVVRSSVDPFSGNGTVLLAQQNVSSNDYLMTLEVAGWRLEDPQEPGHAEFQFPYAEWLHVLPSAREAALARQLQRERLLRERAAAPALIPGVPASMARRGEARQHVGSRVAPGSRASQAQLLSFARPAPGPQVAAAVGGAVPARLVLARSAMGTLREDRSVPAPGGRPGGLAPAAALGVAVLLVVLGRRRLAHVGRG